MDLTNLTEKTQFEDLYTIQKLINKHLEDVTDAKTAFLALGSIPWREPPDGWNVSVVGERLLPAPARIWTTWSSPFPQGENAVWMRRRSDLSLSALRDLDRLLGHDTTDCMLLVPIRRRDNNDGHIILLAILAGNKKADGFSPSDLHAVHRCFEIQVLGRLVAAIELEEERRKREACQTLLAVAENLFSHLDEVEVLMRRIMSEARNLTQAERCSFFLLEKEHNNRKPKLVARIFDDATGPSVNSTTVVLNSADQGVVGHVALTGRFLNIADAGAHPLSLLDKNATNKTRNILCFPVKDAENAVLGVVELTNKSLATGFTRVDEELVAGKFATFCGIALVQALRYKKVRDAQHRSCLSNELMMYHMKVTNDEVSKVLLEESLVVDGRDQFGEFHFIPRSMDESNTPAAVVAVFQDLGLKERWSINKETLSRFVLMVRKGYRDPPYHNWMHAFSVFHFSYLLIKRLQLVERGYLTELESLAMLVSSLCHDVDHRGTTNSFQLASNSVLAVLYSSEGSVMERHHFAQTMCILNTESCNIFENLSSSDYTRCLDLMQDIILATDLAHHLRIFQNLKDLVESGYDRSRPDHHQLLLYLIMTTADLSDQTKDWKSSRNAALLVYREFFSQGDLEKAMGNRPVEMMDRDKACIPSLQIQFIDDVALPVYSLLAQLFPDVQLLVDNVNRNRQHWVTLEDGHIVSPMEILTNDID